MKRLEQMKKQYSSYVKIPKNNTQYLIDFLSQKLDCIPQSDNFMGTYFLNTLIENTYNCILNKDFLLSKESFHFNCFTITRNKKSDAYYKEMDDNEPIYIIFEQETGYIESNCNLLFLEIFIEKGIDNSDLISENDYCKTYFSYLEQLISTTN